MDANARQFETELQAQLEEEETQAQVHPEANVVAVRTL
jgi:hypothetical protein